MSEPLPVLPLLLEPAALLPHLHHPQLLIVDLSQEGSYVHSHVPGAVFLPFRAIVNGQPPAPGRLPPLEILTEVFAMMGLRPDCHVVAYDDEGGGWAGRLIWALDMVGFTRTSYLNGGIHAWRMQELPLDDEQHYTPATPMALQWQAQPSVDKTHILDRLGASDFIIWDARTPGEYRGERVMASKGGHMPGAVNYDWTWAMDPQAGLKLRNLDDIRRELASLGITPDKEVVTHCQSHHRSGLTYLLGRILGFPNIRAYPGSWSEWGNSPETPAITGANPR
jgi:thiosulfate/3-mercaptopyruvate sulfurtransferase